MSEISLEEAKIKYEDEWLSKEDLTKKIQEKMEAGDMSFAQLASALEELSKAMENAHTIEVSLTISTEEYERLKSLGGDDDSMCVRKAISAYIGSSSSGTDDKGGSQDQFLG